MGRSKALLPLSMLLSALSALVGMMPYIMIWLIIKTLLATDGELDSEKVVGYAWWATRFAIGSVLLYFLALMSSHLAAFKVESNIRRHAMRNIVRMPLGFFDNNTSGRIRKIIDDNAGITHGFLAHQMPDLAASILMPLTAFVFIFVFDWRLGLATLVPIFTAMAIMSLMMGGKKGQSFMRQYMTSLEEMNTEAVEYVRGIPVVKVFQQTIYSFKNFHKSIMKYNEMVGKHTKMWKQPMSIYTMVINSFVFFLAPIAILLIGFTGNYASVLLNFILYVLITPVFSQSIMKSMYLNQAFGQAKEAMERLDKLTDFPMLPQSEEPKKIENYNIAFNNVTFSYPNAKEKAVDNISFRIPKGKTFALVGASGGGKTTIARLVPRFWNVNNGEVSIGGVNVKQISQKDLMHHVSFVFQNTKLFKTTLLENIKFGNPNASTEDVEHALDMARCRDIIDKQPLGLMTKIGVDGTYLSGGEQQRIVLARAILKNAPIVVLDEATAFADPENEHLIHQALKELTKGKTVLMIAHRLTSITGVDCILVIDKGKIVEQGTHLELIGKEGIYHNMWMEYQQSVRWTIGKEAQHA